MSTSSHSAFSGGTGGESLLYGSPQALSSTHRLQAARNAGALVTLPFELAPAALELDGQDILTALPRFPRNFLLDSAFVTTYDFEQDNEGDMSLYLHLYYGEANTLAEQTQSFINGYGYQDLALSGNMIPINQSVRCHMTYTYSSGPYIGYAHGLVLWLRGVWQS